MLLKITLDTLFKAIFSLLLGDNMIKKTIIFVSVGVLLGITLFCFNIPTNLIVPSSAQNTSPAIPEQIIYRHLFRHIAAFKARADELERQGKDGRSFHDFFKNKASLSDEQAQMLEQTALQCALEMKAIDERAKTTIQA